MITVFLIALSVCSTSNHTSAQEAGNLVLSVRAELVDHLKAPLPGVEIRMQLYSRTPSPQPRPQYKFELETDEKGMVQLVLDDSGEELGYCVIDVNGASSFCRLSEKTGGSCELGKLSVVKLDSVQIRSLSKGDFNEAYFTSMALRRIDVVEACLCEAVRRADSTEPAWKDIILSDLRLAESGLEKNGGGAMVCLPTALDCV